MLVGRSRRGGSDGEKSIVIEKLFNCLSACQIIMKLFVALIIKSYSMDFLDDSLENKILL